MIRGTEFALLCWTLVFAGGATGLAYLPARVPPPVAEQPFGLRATDQQGRIRVDWDAKHELVRKAEAAALEVQDGDRFQRYPIARDVLSKGGFDYVRRTPDVLLTLTLYDGGQARSQVTVRSIGAPMQASGAAPAREGTRARRR